MTVEQLTQEIARVGGKVFIGFKDSSATEAMDERGNVLTSRSVVAAMTRTLREQGVVIEREYRMIPAVAARIAPETVAELLDNPWVEYVEPQVSGSAITGTRESSSGSQLGVLGFSASTPGIETGVRRYGGLDAFIQANDTTWNIKKVRADSVWGTTTGTGAKLLIIDDGTYPHGDLDYQDMSSCGLNEPVWVGAHGLSVAGVAAAIADAEHVVGVSPAVGLYSVAAGGVGGFANADVICAVEYGDSVGVDVINMSFKMPENTSVTTVLLAAYASGIVLVGATGDDGVDEPVSYPAKLGVVIAVGAVNSNDILWNIDQDSGSHTGPEVELVAPATSIKTLCRTSVDTLCTWKGTSFAAPHVAGAAALLRAYNSAWTPDEIRRRLALGAQDISPAGRDNSTGYGRLNIKAALNLAAPNPATVDIDGPTLVRPFVSCSWTASVSGGVAPLTYTSNPTFAPTWTLDYQNTSNHGESFTVSFQALGADWAIGSKTITVNVSTSAPVCPS